MKNLLRRILAPAAVAAALAPGLALAHPGTPAASEPLLAGILHPLSGADHLLAAVLVGLWSAHRLTRQPWAAPALFVAALTAGALLGTAGLALPWVEPLTAASVLALGLVLAVPRACSAGAGLALAAAAGLWHGVAHTGGEAVPLSFLGGLALTTAGLHGAGMALARHLAARDGGNPAALHWLGILAAGTGAALTATA